DDSATTPDAGLDAGFDRPSRYETTLVPANSEDASVFLSAPHEVSLLDVDGNPLVPPVTTTSGPQGQISIELPATAVSLYVIGVGPADEPSSSADTVVLNTDWWVKGSLLRISTRGLEDESARTSEFTPRADRAALAGSIFWTQNRMRRGSVGCAKVYIDGALAPDEDQAQRYLGNTPLFLPLSVQPQTTRLGAFYFGNIRIGLHTIRVSLDDGRNFIGQAKFTVGRPRSGASSPTKVILYQISIDIEAPSDPTPATCPFPGQ
ncbi:MAG TPA: hypothetical protein VFX59_26760, partial [Polyangiales bacterium]|nr:hypothetical protein [Polyangiales bacterium]